MVHSARGCNKVKKNPCRRQGVPVEDHSLPLTTGTKNAKKRSPMQISMTPKWKSNMWLADLN